MIKLMREVIWQLNSTMSASPMKVPEHPAYRTSPSGRSKDRRSESSEVPEVVKYAGQPDSRFYDPQEGTVKVNGINVKDYPQGELCSEIGVVMQKRSILFKGSIRDNLKWGNDQASDEDLWKAITIAQAKDVVEF